MACHSRISPTISYWTENIFTLLSVSHKLIFMCGGPQQYQHWPPVTIFLILLFQIGKVVFHHRAVRSALIYSFPPPKKHVLWLYAEMELSGQSNIWLTQCGNGTVYIAQFLVIKIFAVEHLKSAKAELKLASHTYKTSWVRAPTPDNSKSELLKWLFKTVEMSKV